MRDYFCIFGTYSNSFKAQNIVEIYFKVLPEAI